MQTNAQSISEISPSTTHEIGDSVHQGTLPVGPTGRVHKSTLPDNRAFWESVNAVEFTSRGVTRQQVFRAVAFFCALTDARVCFASVATLAKKARLGTTATRAQLRALERDAYIETDGGRSGGRSATHYRLSTQRVSVPNATLSVAQPNAQRCVNPTLSVAEEVKKEVSEERTGAQPTQNYRSNGTDNPLDRYTCHCGNSWPKSHGPVCFQCHKSVLPGSRLQTEYAARYRSAHNPGSGAAPVPGKYDSLFDGDEPKPDTPPMAPENVASLEADAVSNGYHKRDGQWTKNW